MNIKSLVKILTILFTFSILTSCNNRIDLSSINYQSDLNKIIRNSLSNTKKYQSKIIEEQNILNIYKQCCKSSLTDIESLVYFFSESGLKPNTIAEVLCSTPERIRSCRSRINKKNTDCGILSIPRLQDE